MILYTILTNLFKLRTKNRLHLKPASTSTTSEATASTSTKAAASSFHEESDAKEKVLNAEVN